MTNESYTPIVLRVNDPYDCDEYPIEWFLIRHLTDDEKKHILKLASDDDYVYLIEQYLIDIDALNIDDEIIIAVDAISNTVKEY